LVKDKNSNLKIIVENRKFEWKNLDKKVGIQILAVEVINKTNIYLSIKNKLENITFLLWKKNELAHFPALHWWIFFGQIYKCVLLLELGTVSTWKRQIFAREYRIRLIQIGSKKSTDLGGSGLLYKFWSTNDFSTAGFISFWRECKKLQAFDFLNY